MIGPARATLRTIFKTLASEPDTEWNFMDGRILKAHQHSSGARRGEPTGIVQRPTFSRECLGCFAHPIKQEDRGPEERGFKTSTAPSDAPS